MDKAEILAEINRLTQILAERENPAAPAIRTVKVEDLEWQADVADEVFTWEEAKEYAASLGDGWRLPTVPELVAQFDYDLGKPKSESWKREWYWSSSPVSGAASSAWNVNFGYGYSGLYDVGAAFRVRCVREAKP